MKPFDDHVRRINEFYKTIGAGDETMKKICPPELPNGSGHVGPLKDSMARRSVSSPTFLAENSTSDVTDPAFKDIRDVTSIQVIRKKS